MSQFSPVYVEGEHSSSTKLLLLCNVILNVCAVFCIINKENRVLLAVIAVVVACRTGKVTHTAIRCILYLGTGWKIITLQALYSSQALLV